MVSVTLGSIAPLDLASLDLERVDPFEGLAWYAVMAKHREFATAVQHLRNQSYDVFAPEAVRMQWSGGKIEHVRTPLFGRYLFAGVNQRDGQPVRPILSTRGVHCIMRSASGRMESIHPSALRAIVARFDPELGGVLVSPRLTEKRQAPDWRPGTPLRVTSGPFAGMEALCSSCAADRVSVLFQIMGREVRGEVPVEAVQPVDVEALCAA